MNRRELFKGTLAVLAAAVLPAAAEQRLVRVPEMEMYSVEGTTIFPVFLAAGGIAARVVLFPMIRLPEGALVYCHESFDVFKFYYGPRPDVDPHTEELERQAKAAFAVTLRSGDPYEKYDVVREGGFMPGKIVRFLLRPDAGKFLNA